MDDEFGDDADFAAVAASFDRPPPTASRTTAIASKIQQPKPQALPSRTGPSSILVSTRQKGNPSLNYIRNVPWEYGDIPADYVLGATTCALFLSLKYHRLHPEYVYSRIRALGQKYNLRILLTMVDIQNHEESLKELSKTSLINNLTLILCWSAPEAGRYLELYKSYEHASPQSIRAHQATSYSEKLVEFVTVPRSINKTDAVSLVSAFGSIRAAVNARPEEIGEITGWGDKKVQRWCGTVREPFRVRKAAKRRAGMEKAGSSVEFSRGVSTATLPREDSGLFVGADDVLDDGSETRPTAPPERVEPIPLGRAPMREASGSGAAAEQDKRPSKRPAGEVQLWEPGEDEEEEALFLAAAESESFMTSKEPVLAGSKSQTNSHKSKETLDDGVAAALAKLRR